MDIFEHWVQDRWARNKNRTFHEVPFPLVAALGLPGEVGEVIEHLKKHYRDGKHPGEELKLELGDVLHYLVVIALSYGWTLEDLQRANARKLAERDRKSGGA